MNRNWVVLLTAGGVSVAGFIAFRQYVRKETARVLREEYEFDQILTRDPRIAAVARLMNLPTSDELAESVVPIASLVMPEQAINDILENQRESIYWPKNRQVSPSLKPVDNIMFALLRASSERQKELEAK
jgi:hypothetical protein